MAHRPPAHPLPRGVVWRPFTAGSPVGRPLAERAYITPRYPDGISESDLLLAPAEVQAETAEIWFLSNYQPATLSGAPLGLGGYIPSAARTPAETLRNEFGSPLEIAFNILAGRASLASAFWEPMPDQPPSLAADDGQTLLTLPNVQDELRERIDHLERIIEELGAARGGVGHNQGPPLLDAPQLAAIVVATLQARDGISAGDKGKPAVAGAQTALTDALMTLGKGLLGGIGYKAGKDVYSPAKHLAIQLFCSLHEVVALLEHWLATHSPMIPV
jgi:hypothetical protein